MQDFAYNYFQLQDFESKKDAYNTVESLVGNDFWKEWSCLRCGRSKNKIPSFDRDPVYQAKGPFEVN